MSPQREERGEKGEGEKRNKQEQDTGGRDQTKQTKGERETRQKHKTKRAESGVVSRSQTDVMVVIFLILHDTKFSGFETRSLH